MDEDDELLERIENEEEPPAEIPVTDRKVPTAEHLLKGKKPNEKWVRLALDSGEVVDLRFRAIGTTAYDRLVSKYPPTPAQKKDGLLYDLNRFAPALFHYCLVEPELSMEEAKELWNSDAWNRGELSALFMAAVEVNNKGLDIPFTPPD